MRRGDGAPITLAVSDGRSGALRAPLRRRAIKSYRRVVDTVPGFPRLKDAYDIVIVGGGHAGLQAGLKAGLLRKTAIVIDRGPKYSRSYYAPRMDNIPGFPEGVSGHKLLDQQIAAVRKVDEFVDYFTPAVAASAERSGSGYAVRFEWLKQSLVARGSVLVLAMGVVDRIPEVGGMIDPIFPWANQALVDFCLISRRSRPGRQDGRGHRS